MCGWSRLNGPTEPASCNVNTSVADRSRLANYLGKRERMLAWRPNFHMMSFEYSHVPTVPFDLVPWEMPHLMSVLIVQHRTLTCPLVVN